MAFQGAMLETIPSEGETLKIKGSVMLAYAESEEEVLAALKDDPYYRSNIWDWEKVSFCLGSPMWLLKSVFFPCANRS